jgi:hypothetical protein
MIFPPFFPPPESPHAGQKAQQFLSVIKRSFKKILVVFVIPISEWPALLQGILDFR